MLSSIPDEGTAIIETRNPNNPKRLNYLNQSNQGSLIVHPITTINPAEQNGSGRMQLIGPSAYTNADQGQSCVEQKFARLEKYPGTVERSLPVGNNLQKIEGTGRWNYTGTIKNFTQNNFTNGFAYSLGFYNTIGGTGSGATVEITAVDSNGSITGVQIASVGMNYTNGDILTIVDNALNYGNGTININSLASVIYNNSAVTINTRGSGYVSENGVEGYNLSANNLIVEGTFGLPPVGAQFVILISVSIVSVTDVSRYPVGTVMRLYSTEVAIADQALIEVLTNDGVNITIGIYNWSPGIPVAGGRAVYASNDPSTFLFNTQIISQRRRTKSLMSSKNMSLSISALNDGTVDTVNILDMGTNNKNGDLILINQPNSGLNCIFVLDNQVSNITNFSTNLIKGGAGYYHNEYFITDWPDGNNPPTLINPDYQFINNAQINNPGKIYSDRNINIGGIKPGGTLTQLTIPLNVFPTLPTYTGNFGSIQTVLQPIPISQDVTPQPIAGAIPPTGWPTFVNRQNATFYQDIRLFIRESGTGYTVGTNLATIGGSGTGMTLNILSVDDNGFYRRSKCFPI